MLGLVADHPVVLAMVLVAVLAAGCLAGVARDLSRLAIFGLGLALLVTAINPLVSREGLTVVARLGEAPPVGELDITLEAIAYGGVLGLRALVVVLAFGLWALAVNPDEVLRLFRRISYRSALTATLATRMVGVLRRDGRRLADAQRCRPDGGASRVAVMRAVATGALDRAVDVAAALEVRGYGIARRPARRPQPWSRHDIAFATAAGAFVAIALMIIAGAASFDAYPRLEVETTTATLVLAAAVPLVAALPFAERRGVLA